MQRALALSMVLQVSVGLALQTGSGTYQEKTFKFSEESEDIVGVAASMVKEVKEAQSPALANEKFVHGLDRLYDAGVPKTLRVPTTTKCIIIIVAQYLIVYMCLAVCRTYHEVAGIAKGRVEAALAGAAQALTYGPMVCALFIACRMRVEFASEGTGEPQLWVQICMYVMTFSVLASALLVLLIPLAIGRALPIKEGPCDLENPEMIAVESKAAFFLITTIRYFILAGLYGGLFAVIYGIYVYLPLGVKDASEIPPPAPAVMCTIVLSVLFFSTQLIIALCRTYTEFVGVEFPRIAGIMNGATSTVEFAPMLAIIFLAVRMRALQHDCQPQAWAQACMFAATGAMCVTTLLAILVPLTLAATIKTNKITGETSFELPSPAFGYGLIALRFLYMLCFYGCVLAVIFSIYDFEAPEGLAATLPVSPTLQCIVNLTCQFFFVHLVLIFCQTVYEVSGGCIPLETYTLYAALQAAKSTLAFAPMLSILFVTARMYSLLITDKRGAPQTWVQDSMSVATWSLAISFLLCMLTGFLMEVAIDQDGNVVHKFSNRYSGVFMILVRYVAMLAMYGGILMVVVGIFVITPETANGHGSVPVTSDGRTSSPSPHGSLPMGAR